MMGVQEQPQGSLFQCGISNCQGLTLSGPNRSPGKNSSLTQPCNLFPRLLSKRLVCIKELLP